MKYRIALVAAVVVALAIAAPALGSSVSGAFVSIGADSTYQADPAPHPTPTTPSVQDVFGYTICADPATFPQNCGPGSPQEGAGQPPDGYVVTCDHGYVYASYSAEAGTLTGLGTYTITCNAYDPNGNLVGTGTTTRTIYDSTPPTIYGPGDQSATTTGSHGVPVSWTISAQDNVDGTRSVSCDHASGSLFFRGTTVVTCSASDLSGNSATYSFNVVVTQH